MRSRRRSIAAVCIVAVLLAGLLPGHAWLDAAWIQPLWVLLPDDTPLEVCSPLRPAPEQPLPLLAALASRGPPPAFLT
jgi:hypothetical protein